MAVFRSHSNRNMLTHLAGVQAKQPELSTLATALTAAGLDAAFSAKCVSWGVSCGVCF